MRNLKKVLALVIAFSMMLSVVAFAGYNDVDADADYAGAVELLSALEIFEGDDKGNFNPDNTITRAEAAAVVCRALGLENSAEGAKGVTAFTDVAADHWATGYINLATQSGIINGHGDGTFAPEAPVTYEQIVKMVVCALGFEPMAAEKGGYPTGYLVVANAYKVTAGVAASIEAPRKTVAQLVANALTTPKMSQAWYGADAKWEVLDGKNDRDYATLLTDRDIYIVSGTVDTKNYEEDTVTLTIKESSVDNEFYFDDGGEKKDYAYTNATVELAINGSDIANYLTQYVDAYVQKIAKGKYEVLAVVPSEAGETFALAASDVDEIKAGEDRLYYFVDGTTKTKYIRLSADVEYVENKDEKTLISGLADVTVKLNGFDKDSEEELVFVENDNDGKFDKIIATKYSYDVIEEVDAKNGRIRLEDARAWLNVEEDADTVEFVFVNADGSELTIADFAEDDVVAYYADNKLKNAEYIKVIKLTDNAVEGVVTEKATQNGKPYVWINGEKYLVDSKVTGDVYAIEAEGTFYIDMTGKIFKFEGTSVAGNYAYILEAAKDKSMFADKEWKVKLLTVADGVVTYTFSDEGKKDFDTIIAKLAPAGAEEWLFDVVATEDATEKDGEGNPIYKKGDQIGNQVKKELKNKNRLVTYKTNSKGEIKDITIVDAANLKDVDKEYIAKSQKIDGNVLADNTVLFNVNADEAEDAYATDISYLVDDVNYEGYVVKVDNEVELFVVYDGGQAIPSDEVGFAIVTDVREVKEDGEDFVVVSYIQDMNEGTVTFGEDTKTFKDTTDATANYKNIEIGDVFVFNADSNGYVLEYAVLATIENKGAEFNVIGANLEVFSEDNEFVYGYIFSDKDQSKKSAYEEFEVGGIEEAPVEGKIAEKLSLYVYDYTNTYSYYAGRRDVEIETDYIVEDADWYFNDGDFEDEATFFFARLVDGDLVDLYTAGTRVVGLDKIKAAADKAVYTNASNNDAHEYVKAAPVALTDRIAAAPVAKLIKALDKDSKKEVVNAAYDQYDALTKAQKELLPEDLVKTLKDLHEKVNVPAPTPAE